jgi:hypothetical protein
MPKPAGANDSKDQASRTDTGRTYDRSVKIGDPGGATEDNPKPTRPFVDPDPKSIHDFGDPLNQRGPD